MDVKLTGKIEETTFNNNTHTTLLMTPAPDSYSQPSTYKLKSDMPLGNVGQEITVECQMRGFIRRRSYNDKQTGQPKTFLDDNVVFSVFKVHAKPEPVRAAS